MASAAPMDIHHDRISLPSYLSEENKKEMISLGFKVGDIKTCWLQHFKAKAVKGKCMACGLVIRVPPYLAKIIGQKYSKDPDRPHAMFVYSQPLEDMEIVNPQKREIRHRRHNDEESSRDDVPDKVEVLMDGGNDMYSLTERMADLGRSWSDAFSVTRARCLAPVCFECYLGAKKVAQSLGFHFPSFHNVPGLVEKKKSLAHMQMPQPQVKEEILRAQMLQRLAWCTLPGSRHCIYVMDNGYSRNGMHRGFKVCAKRRPVIIREHLEGRIPSVNDYCCMEHRSEHNTTAIMPPEEYIGMYAHRSMY